MNVYLNEFNIFMNDRVYLPISSGLIRSYSESINEIRKNYNFKQFFFIREPAQKILGYYDSPNVVGFSSSMWNFQLNLELAKSIKIKFPGCLIVFGGPHVPQRPNETESFLENHPFIDVAVRGEGEIIFSDILTRFLSTSDFSDISGISFKNYKTNQIIRNIDRLAIDNLNLVPSPYLNGYYDQYIQNKSFQYQMILETSRGCPFRCSFCYWGSSKDKKLREFNLERLGKEIEWAAKNEIEYIFCADSNFGILKRDYNIASVIVQAKTKFGYPKIFRACYDKNVKNNNNFNIAELLNRNSLAKGVTLSRQSENVETLNKIHRNNSSINSYKELQDKYYKANISTYTEFILGLPGETYDSFVDGVEKVAEISASGQFNIFLCVALPNTEITDETYIKDNGMEFASIRLVEFHSSPKKSNETIEYEKIIVGTKTMNNSDWTRSVIFSWMFQLFYGLKMGFFILLYLNREFKIKYSDYFTFILNKAKEDKDSYPVINNEISFYNKSIEHLLKGEPQCVFLKEFGDISWPIDEASYLNLSNSRISFFHELFKLTQKYLQFKNIKFNKNILMEIFNYQAARLPNYIAPNNIEIYFKYNIPEYFDKVLKNIPTSIIEKKQEMRVKNFINFNGDKETFAKEIVWFGRKNDKMVYDIEF